MKTTPIRAGVGFCLTFNNDEIYQVDAILKENGYETSKEGLMAFILDGGGEYQGEAEQTVSERLGASLRDAIKNNPELTETLAKDGIDLARKMFAKKFKR